MQVAPFWARVRETIYIFTTFGASPPGIAHTVVAIYLVLSERSTILVNTQRNHLEFCDCIREATLMVYYVLAISFANVLFEAIIFTSLHLLLI